MPIPMFPKTYRLPEMEATPANDAVPLTSKSPDTKTSLEAEM